MEDIVLENNVLFSCSRPKAIAWLESEAKKAFRVLQGRHPEIKDMFGVWFTIWRMERFTEGLTPFLEFPVEILPAPKALTYRHFAGEKASRLNDNPDHISSFQSRDVSSPVEALHKYGGAIRCGGGFFILSCSGLPEDLDQEFCILVALALHLLTEEQANEIRGTTVVG